jgi:hypothetical protein
MDEESTGRGSAHILSMAAQEYWNDVANQPFDSQDGITQSLECRKEDTCTEEPLSSVAQLVISVAQL